MKTRPRSCPLLLCCFLALLSPAPAHAQNAVATFSLADHLKHAWTNELVFFPVDAAVWGRKDLALLGPDGKPAPHQWATAEQAPNGKASVAFNANVPEFGKARHSLVTGTPPAPLDEPRVSETPHTFELVNGHLGLRLRKSLKAGEGPIAGIRLGSGTWTGDSTLTEAPAIKSYATEITARGPLFADLVCRIVFADDGRWSLRFRMKSGEPVILVAEDFDAPGGGTFGVTLGGETFRPTQLLYRAGMYPNIGMVSVANLPAAGHAYTLEPWLHWWSAERQGNWFGLFTPSPLVPPAGGPAEARPNDPLAELKLDGAPAKPAPGAPARPRDPSSDMLVVGVLRPSLWVTPGPEWRGKAKQAGGSVSATTKAGVTTLHLPVLGGARHWLLGAIDKQASAAALLLKDRRVAPPAQQLLIKHGIFPLDEVKDMVLDWTGDHDNHPRLYLRKQDLPALKARLTPNPVMLRKWTVEQPINKYYLDEPIQEFIASGNAQLGKLMAAKGAEFLQFCVDRYVAQDSQVMIGTAPHTQTLIISALNLLDAVLGTDVVSPAERRRLLAQIAFLGYVVNSHDFWSPARGFSANPNMTTTVANFQAAIGCMIPSHPRAKEWSQRGLTELRRQLREWSAEDGGWLEAPHYAMTSFDFMLGSFLMAANAGFGDDVYADRMRKVIEWFASIVTPRDSRTGGFRHQPPIGNTYHGEPTGLFGVVAGLWKDRDPAFAARMQALHEEGGSFGNLGTGWDFPTMSGYRFLLTRHGVPPKSAPYGSAAFAQNGAVLRSGMGSARETYLHLIAGQHHEHYDYDSGSIMLYGKGRVLADDWGYLGRHPDKWHSLLTSGAAGGGGLMHLDAFAPAAAFDYVSGKKDAWRRQIGFVKDADPNGPAFFLVRDTHAADTPATWRLWLTTGIAGDGDKKKWPTPGAVTLNATGATLSGMDDVDMDIFFPNAAALGLKLEPATLRVSTGNWLGSIEPVSNSQTALIATLKGRGAVVALLYPRLKTEPPPAVSWFADGRIAAVKSPAGTDYVLVTPAAPPQPVGDGKTLEPLREHSTKDGITVLSLSGDPQLTFTVNPTTTALADRTLVIPAHSIAVHPGPTNPVTVVWQSPGTGSISVECRLHDGNNGGGNGILAELRHGSTVLAKGALANGGTNLVLRIDNAAMARGDLLRLVVLPGDGENANWWDTTLIEMTVRDGTGKQWNVRESLLRGEPLGNQLSRDWEHTVWWVCSGDAQKFDPKALLPPVPETFATPDGNISFQGTAGAVRIRGGKTTLTLGAAGKISAGSQELAAGNPATKE